MKADMAVRSMSKPISRPAALRAPLMISTVMGPTCMVVPFYALVLPSLATAETIPDGIHLCQARLLQTTAASCQFLFDAPEAVFEFSNGLTQRVLRAQMQKTSQVDETEQDITELLGNG